MGAKALTTYGRRLHDADVFLWLSNTVDRQPSPFCWWCVSCEVCVGQHGELRLLKHASAALVMSFLLLPMATGQSVKVNHDLAVNGKLHPSPLAVPWFGHVFFSWVWVGSTGQDEAGGWLVYYMGRLERGPYSATVARVWL
jgi:hypothetical protein